MSVEGLQHNVGNLVRQAGNPNFNCPSRDGGLGRVLAAGEKKPPAKTAVRTGKKAEKKDNNSKNVY